MTAFRKNSFRLFLELRHMAIFIVIGDGLSFISIYMWYTWDLQAFVFWCSIGVTDLGKFDLSWTKWALCRSSYKKSFDPQGRKKPPNTKDIYHHLVLDVDRVKKSASRVNLNQSFMSWSQVRAKIEPSKMLRVYCELS